MTPAPKRRISLIVARADNGVIGHQGGLPWHIPDDLRHFKRLTVGKPVVMGRRTHESIGKPLPGRHNIIVTRQKDYEAPGCTVVHTLADALTSADPAPEVMVIGGAELYAQCLPLADRVYLTQVHADVAGDTRLAPFDPSAWTEVSRQTTPAGPECPAFSFVLLERSDV